MIGSAPAATSPVWPARFDRSSPNPGDIRGDIPAGAAIDGKSFRVDRITRSNTRRRLGLLGMRERVEMVGGKLAIESTPGKGTTVRAEVPIRPPPGKSNS